MSEIVCRGGYANLGGRCLPMQARGKATKKAKHAIYSKEPKGFHNAMPSNEAKQEVRGTRNVVGDKSNAYRGNTMGHESGNNVSGGSDDRWGVRHGDRMTHTNTPSGPKNATVTGGTGFRRGTPSNAESHIVTNPQKRGVTPKIGTSGRKRHGVNQGYMKDIKRAIKGNGDYGSNTMPSNQGTGGGEGPYHGYRRDSMGNKKPKGFLKKRRQKGGHNSGGFLNHRRDAF